MLYRFALLTVVFGLGQPITKLGTGELFQIIQQLQIGVGNTNAFYWVIVIRRLECGAMKPFIHFELV